MELPARLCGLWALLLCFADGRDAAPTGECSPWARGGDRGTGESSAGPRAAAGVGAGGFLLIPSAGRRQPPGQGSRWATLEQQGLPGFRAATAAVEREDDSPPHFPCAVGKSQGARRRGAGPKHARCVVRGRGGWLEC